MKKIQILYLFFTVLLLGSTCRKENEYCHKKVSIINESEKAIYVTFDTHFPDTAYFGHGQSPASDEYNNKISAKSSSDRPLYILDCWEAVFNYETSIPSDTLMIFVFDAEVLEKEEWGDVVHYYKVLKRYDLSLGDLQRLNWTITYP